MIIKWNNTKALVIEQCIDAFGTLPYKFIKSRSAFERNSAGERRSVNVLFTASPLGNRWMSAWCAIRNNEIEKIFHRTSGVEKSGQSVYTTIIFSTGGQMSTNTEEETINFILSTRNFIKNIAIPFLEREYSYTDYSNLLNSNPTDWSCPYHGNPQNRCHYGLIAAKLSNDPRYPELVTIYSEFMRTNNKGFYFPRFQKLLYDLDTYVC